LRERLPRVYRERRKGGADAVLVEYSGCTNVGKARPNNEDALLAGTGRDERLFVVADGMGGHEAGEVASFLAVATLEGLWPAGSLVGAIRRADRTIFACRDDGEFAEMGTTVVALRFHEDGSHKRGAEHGLEAEVAHVGDSRAYLLRAGHLRRLTEDHSVAAELVRSGALVSTRVASRNALTRSLGTGTASVESKTFEAWPGDRVLLCSDGLSDAIAEKEIASVLERFPGDPEKTAHGLVTAALEAGGPDNVTVVVVDLKDRGSASTLPAGAPDDEPGDARHSTRRRSVSDPAFPGL
jgi:serine/threonine protein phosphatase PrpC